MYILTFYSFKGGVGRTLALVNVAMELIRRGHKVLLVDLDLEAPGLDAFPELRSPARVPGLVEFVSKFIETGSSPDVTDYVFTCPVEPASGELRMMPSGIRDSTYSSRLQAIDWQRLYADQDGYLLFEDLKAQWAATLKPNYVLIDSRTGHTDVGGICTRQLPDAVVVCFVPNEENVRGLETIVAEIRGEAQGSLKRSIELFFVPSNVPNLDDEKGILARHLADAQRRLGFDKPACTVHRYDSLSLLDNDIFTSHRPTSRLAKECKRLTDAITKNNLEDRGVALRFLSNPNVGETRPKSGHQSLDLQLNQIRLSHARDGEVIHALGLFTKRLGRDTEANALIESAEKLGYRSAEALVDAAYRNHSAGDSSSAVEALRQALALPSATYFDLNRAIRLIVDIDVGALGIFREAPGMRARTPGEVSSLCQEMMSARAALPVVESVLRYHSARLSKNRETHPELNTMLVLCLIGQRKYGMAMQAISDVRPEPKVLGVADSFNYAMAEWGASEQPPVDLFSRVVELGAATPAQEADRNFYQCLAIANWVSGHPTDAMSSIESAERLARTPSMSFSCWRYLQVDSDHFNDDVQCVRRMLTGERIAPEVFVSSAT